MAAVLPHIVDDYLDQKNQLAAMIGFLDSKIRQIKFLHELSTVLQTSLDLDEVLSVAMTAITAGKGFGMNRAFLLMVDKERTNLLGYLGVGPRSYDEAWQTWDDICKSNFSLKEMAKHFQKNKLFSEKVKFHYILEQLKIPLNDSNHLFIKVLREKKPVLVEDAFNNPEVDRNLATLLGVDCFLVMPLISRNRRIGVILADNCITHKPITPQDMQSLETFAFPVAFALERASLYERLQEEVVKQVEANRKLREQQELIVKMEKMALVGKITSSVAHSIRNPLTVIGGFARSLLKSTAESDWKKEYLESIVRETKQLEEVLAEVLNYSESLHPVTDLWDVNHLVAAVREELRYRMEHQGINCVLEQAQDLPPVRLDYKQISYCVRTIITTAMESILNEGEIRISTGMEGNDLLITVCDNGAAIDQKEIEILTTPFFDTQELGAGVGLQLCRSILERHGSSLLIKSGAESGTCYFIRLPITKEEYVDGQATVG
jgi:signal transduction histidine kinase